MGINAIENFINGNYMKFLINPIQKKSPYVRGTAHTYKDNKDVSKDYVYEPNKKIKIGPNGLPLTVINLDGNWIPTEPNIYENGTGIWYDNGNRSIWLTKTYDGNEQVSLYSDGKNVFGSEDLDQERNLRNIKARLNPKYNTGGELKNNDAIYDYDEFINQFAGVQEYKCGGKTKIESASCGCKSKKVKKAESGMKNKKQDPDANDNAAVEPGKKVDPWMLNLDNKKSLESLKPSFIQLKMNQAKNAFTVVNTTKKLLKRK